MLCLIDNYDSFTYNIVHYLHELSIDVRVILNDEMSVSEVIALNPTHLVLSPGPGTPDDSGISKELLLEAAKRKIPTLGICLGHEIIGEVFGARVKHAKSVMHGKASRIRHHGDGIFANTPKQFLAARYHSLIVEHDQFPACLNITAWTNSANNEFEEIMALSHRDLPIYGVQFHPESIMTEHGHQLLSNFIRIKSEVERDEFSNVA